MGFEVFPTPLICDIFDTTEAYKSDPAKGLEIINNMLKSEYECFQGSRKQFVYTNFDKQTYVYYTDSIRRVRYAYLYSIYIETRKDNKRIAYLRITRDWDWDEPVITKNTYGRTDGKENYDLIFYLKEDEDYDFVKNVMEDLIEKDLNKSFPWANFPPRNIRNLNYYEFN